MLDDNENGVVETTENVEGQATEELVEGVKANSEATTNDGVAEEKLYTQAELDDLVNKKIDEIMPRKIEKAKSKIRREYEGEKAKYSRIEEVLNAGLGTNNLEEATKKLTDFYKEQGVNIPEQPRYSQRDLELIANAEALDIINSGYEDIVEEVDKLAAKGVNNMTPREKLVFKKLAEERKVHEETLELSKLGIGKEILEDSKFKEFASKLNPNLSLTEKYNMYSKFNPKPKVDPIGSMKGDTKKTSEIKEFYTREEALKFTKQDFDKNPELYKAVVKSSYSWK